MDRRGFRSGPPLTRHVGSVAVTVALGLVFWRVHSDVGHEGHLGGAWNLVWADVSVVLLCLILILGPLARLLPRARRLVPWGRELGIAMFVTAGLHLLILLGDSWDILGFFFDWEVHPGDSTLSMTWWAAANWIGLLALVYALVLTATSNDWSQRLLGRGWKFLQRQTYTLFVLVWLHSAGYFLLPTWFWVISGLAVLAQFVGFVHTVRASRGPSPQRPSARSSSGSATTLIRSGKWVAVALLWSGLIFGSLVLANVEVDEMALFCARYEEVQDLPRTEMVLELVEWLPQSDVIIPVPTLIEEC